MGRVLLLYLALILVPGAILAALAFRLAGRERLDALRALDERVETAAERLARQAESALGKALEKAKTRIESYESEGPSSLLEAVAYLTPEGELQYGATPQEPTTPSSASDPGELRYFRLSLAGGESYELAWRDPARALDAYAFYMARIRSPGLRSRLRYRIARAATTQGDRELAAAVLRDLLEDAGGCTEGGLPIDLLAGARLLGLGQDDEREIRSALRARLRETHRHLTTPFFKHFLRNLAIGDTDLARLVEERELLEASFVRCRETLLESGSALDGDGLLVTHETAGGAQALARAEVVWPPWDPGGQLEVQLSTHGPRGEESGGTSMRPLRLGASGPLLAFLRVRDPLYAEARNRVERLWRLGGALVIFTVAVTLLGGLALLRLVVRERRLAQLRARLVANVSHELKSPVTSIRMFSEMLAEDPLDESRTRRFGRLLRGESLRLSQLIENLLDFSRLGRRETELDLEPLDVAAVLHRVAEGFGYRAREKGVRFEVDLPDVADSQGRGGLEVVANSLAVERITLNLLDNALKYRKADAPRIRLTAGTAGNHVSVSVTDNGPGIPRGETERVFEEFYRLRYEDYAIRGSGLGLALARRLARKMGGDIRLESRLGAGSTFSLEIPVREYRHAEGES